MELVKILHDHLFRILVPAIVFVVTLVLGFLARRFFWGYLTRWAQRTTGQIDDIVVRAIRGPFMIWVLMLAIYLTARFSSMPPHISSLVGKILIFLLIVSITVAAARMIGQIVATYGSRMKSTLAVTSLTQHLAQITVIVIGSLILLNYLGISITPILTALGIGGLAVALGLQDTMANFFAGFNVSLSGYIRPGDYIKLNTGEEGYVTDIGWRNTTIRVLANNLVIIPNLKLAQAIVTNYNLPEARMSLLIPVSVAFGSHPVRVEQILMEEVRKGTEEIPGLLAEPEPVVRFTPGFGNSSLDFTVICQVAEFKDQFPVQHELRKRIYARLLQEKIEIPFPTRTVYLRSESGKIESGANQLRS